MNVGFMNFFTRSWLSGELTDEAFDRAAKDYAVHLDRISGELPPVLVLFVSQVSIHDAIVREAIYDSTARCFMLIVTAGDLQAGYSDVRLEYQGVVSLEGMPDVRSVLAAHDNEIAESEVDLKGPQIFEHRFIFDPIGELRVQFAEFNFSLRSRPSHDFGLFPAVLRFS